MRWHASGLTAYSYKRLTIAETNMTQSSSPRSVSAPPTTTPDIITNQYAHLALLLMRQQRWQEAAELLERSEGPESNAQNLLLRALALNKSGRTLAAVEIARRAALLADGKPLLQSAAYFALGMFNRQVG